MSYLPLQYVTLELSLCRYKPKLPIKVPTPYLDLGTFRYFLGSISQR